jgi:L-alanine-DL-glutamate epimerase-like enolase superfamily enzyme
MRLRIDTESWPIRGQFKISRGSKTCAEVVLVTLEQDGYTGRGECVPYAHYGESCASVSAQIEGLRKPIEQGMTREQLQQALHPGAARNALDCALWDLQARQSGQRVWQLLGVDIPEPTITAYTLSLDSPENMQRAAQANAARPLLKLKLAGEGDIERVQAVRGGAPDARLIVDANEGWDAALYRKMVPELFNLGVEMIEQPLPVTSDHALLDLPRPITLCADESCHTRDSLGKIIGKYDMINVKLDKAGGLTEALQLCQQAQAEGLQIMLGSMLATSLAMAPAMLLAETATVVDLDGPLLLERDRQPGLEFTDNRVYPPSPELWG